MSVTSESSKYWKEKSLSILQNFSSGGKKSTYTEMSSNLLRKKEGLEKNLNLQMHEIERIEKELHDIESDEDVDFIKYKLELYQLITNLTWDLDSVPTDVRGYISKPFNTFSMSTNKYSKQHIVNYLWKLISGELQPFTSSS